MANTSIICPVCKGIVIQLFIQDIIPLGVNYITTLKVLRVCKVCGCNLQAHGRAELKAERV